MDIGTGITAGSAVLGAVAVLFKVFPSRNGKSSHCEDHSGVCANLESLDAWLNKIEAKLDRVIEGKAK